MESHFHGRKPPSWISNPVKTSPASKSRQFPTLNTSANSDFARSRPDPADTSPARGAAAALLVRLCAEGSALVQPPRNPRATPRSSERLPAEDQSEWPTSQKDAGGQCLQKQRMRFVERRWNCCRTCAPRGRCRTTTAWISSTTSGTWADRVTRTQVRLACKSLPLSSLAFQFAREAFEVLYRLQKCRQALKSNVRFPQGGER